MNTLLNRIYECHIGMSDEEPHIASYNYFEYHVLPRIIKAGYNCVLIYLSYIQLDSNHGY